MMDLRHAAQLLGGEVSAGRILCPGPGHILGWGMTRAANAETTLRLAGRIQYDNSGRGILIEAPEGEKS